MTYTCDCTYVYVYVYIWTHLCINMCAHVMYLSASDRGYFLLPNFTSQLAFAYVCPKHFM